jgi:sugar phosphate isomerase/epimerase
MARLPEAKVLIVFALQRTLLERLDEATRTEFDLLEQYGETEETIPELDELQNIRERANTYYSRFIPHYGKFIYPNPKPPMLI